MSKLKETKSEKKPETAQKNNFNYMPIANGAIGAIVGIALVLFFSAGFAPSAPQAAPGQASKSISEVSTEVISYVNKNFVAQGATGVVAELKSNEEVNSLYKICVDVKQDGEVAGTECLFATKDGKKALIEVFDLDTPIIETPVDDNPPADTAGPSAASCDSVEKLEKPALDVFVVSRCPFGIQSMNGVVSVAQLLAEDADITVRYISTVNTDGTVSAMHGAEELLENRRQICIREQSADKYWDYIKCYVETGDTATCETSAAIDSGALSTCVAEKSTEYLIADAFWNGEDRSRLASPTFYLNGAELDEGSFDSYNRSPEGIKNRVCCGMLAEADACSEQLQTAKPPTTFGVIGGTAATGGGVSC